MTSKTQRKESGEYSVPKTIREVNTIGTGAWLDFRKGEVGGKTAFISEEILCKMGWSSGLSALLAPLLQGD